MEAVLAITTYANGSKENYISTNIIQIISNVCNEVIVILTNFSIIFVLFC
jgi:hypothetical protein